MGHLPSLWAARDSEQPQLSQPFLTAEVLQPLDRCCGLLWPRSNRSRSILWMQDSRGSGAEGQNPLPHPAAHAAADAAQDIAFDVVQDTEITAP